MDMASGIMTLGSASDALHSKSPTILQHMIFFLFLIFCSSAYSAAIESPPYISPEYPHTTDEVTLILPLNGCIVVDEITSSIVENQIRVDLSHMCFSPPSVHYSVSASLGYLPAGNYTVSYYETDLLEIQPTPELQSVLTFEVRQPSRIPALSNLMLLILSIFIFFVALKHQKHQKHQGSESNCAM